MDLGICDYIYKDDIAEDNADGKFVSKSVISYKTNVIKSGGSSQTFIGKFFDENGDELTDVVPYWRIVCDFSDELEVEERDNSIMVRIDNDDYVDESFKIILSDSNGNYSSSIIVEVDSLL